MNNEDYSPQDLMNSKTPEIHFAILFMEIKYVKGKLQELENEVKEIYNKIEDAKMASIDLEKEFNNFIFKTDTSISSIEKEVNFLGEIKERTNNSFLSNQASPNVFLAFLKMITEYKDVALYLAITFFLIASSIFGAYEALFEHIKTPSITIEKETDKNTPKEGK